MNYSPFPILKYCVLIFVLSAMPFFLTGCGGPSDDKIAEAQSKYIELTDKHNEAVDVHEGVADSSLDQTLASLKEKVFAVAEYNLQEMKDDEIDLLIQTMDTIIASYDKAIQTLSEIRVTEDSALLTPIPLTLVNDTTLTFSRLFLYEDKSRETHTNILENSEGFAPRETITGMLIQRDVLNTPWILSLSDSEDHSYEIILPVEEYEEAGIRLHLSYDSETGELSVS